MQLEYETYKLTVDKVKEEAQKVVTEDEAVCQICHKTKFADGIGHKCHYCHLRSCARCGGRMLLKTNKVGNILL